MKQLELAYANEIEQMNNELKKLRAENIKLEQKRVNFKQQFHACEKKYNEIINSTSWKITAPLRFFVALLKRSR